MQQQIENQVRTRISSGDGKVCRQRQHGERMIIGDDWPRENTDPIGTAKQPVIEDVIRVIPIRKIVPEQREQAKNRDDCHAQHRP